MSFSNTDERTNRPHPMLGAQIGQYRILDVVGGGGMGIVFRARQETVDRDVALKLLPPELAHDEINSKRLEREAKALAKLNHPNIVTTYDFGLTQHGQAYLVMELVDGESLKELLLRDGRMELNRAIKIFIQMADAMRFAHQHGIVHRDLKPHNVMIAQAPSPDFVKVLDFGIARLADSQKLTRVGEIIGSPLYMSPEQCLSEPVDHRTDIYALGVLMYVSLTGHVPFKGDTLYETVERKCTMPPPRFADIAPELDIPGFLEELIRHCLAVEKEDRFQSMDEVKKMLESIGSSQKNQKQFVAESTAVLNGPIGVTKRPAPAPKTIKERMQESAAAKGGLDNAAETKSAPPKLPRPTVSRGSASRPARTRPVSEAKGIVITPGVMVLAVISLLVTMFGGMYLGIKVMDDGTFFPRSSSDTTSGASQSGNKTSDTARVITPVVDSHPNTKVTAAQNETKNGAQNATQQTSNQQTGTRVSTEQAAHTNSGSTQVSSSGETISTGASLTNQTSNKQTVTSSAQSVTPPSARTKNTTRSSASNETVGDRQATKPRQPRDHSRKTVTNKKPVTRVPSVPTHRVEPTTESVTGVHVRHLDPDTWDNYKKLKPF
ncbi:MAG: protein kinase [Candidatus Melainabacteria bacterium]|nr:protein kinase [Candidatus Melainabacteria bacterium]